MAESQLQKDWKHLRYTFRIIAHHPLTRHKALPALKRWLLWQIGSRLVPGPVAVPFVNHTRLLVGPRMHGATLNVYVGLDEFEDMSFLLHFLRPQDLFVDVGAAVGAYTVLAAGAIGASAMAFEPTPEAFHALRANVNLNGFGDRAACYPLAVGREVGTAQFTTGLGTLNHIVPQAERLESGHTEIEMTTLDGELAAGEPALIKIDVEGFEQAVLGGAEATLGRSSLGAMIIEIGKGCKKYGTTPAQTFDRVTGYGFTACRYEPVGRHLTEVTREAWTESRGTNTIFCRDVEVCRDRVGSAPAFRVIGREI